MRIGGTSQGNLREHNEQQILEFIRENPRTTQLEISDEVGLTRAAVAKILGPAPAGSDPPTRLRRVLSIDGDTRPATISLNPSLGFVMSLDIGIHHLRGWSCDLSGERLATHEPRESIDISDAPALALDKAAEVVDRLLAMTVKELASRSNEPASRKLLAGISISVPFPVDPQGVVIANDDWRYVQLPSDLWQRLHWSVPAAVESDAGVGAIAELDALFERGSGIKGLVRSTTDMFYVKWSSAVMAAIIANGSLYRGARGMAGAFAHTPLMVEHDAAELRPCGVCGRVCLNSKSSLDAVISRLSADRADLNRESLGRDAEARATELVKRACRGEDEIGRELHAAARALGAVLGVVANTLNPGLMIVGGAFQTADYTYLAKSVHQGLEETIYAPLRQGLIIQCGRRTGEAAVRGGLSHALREFAAPYLLERLRSDSTANRLEPGEDT